MPAPEQRHCKACGGLLIEDSPLSICGLCVIAMAVQGADDEEETGVAPRSSPQAYPDAVLSVDELQSRFPELEIQEFIGSGGMGAVFRALQPGPNRLVALKVLATALAKNEEFVERFQREAQMMGRLDHPNIVRVHDAGERGGIYYLIMDYMDGGDLRRLIKKGGMDMQLVQELVPHICAGLSHAHEEGITHRDIKPANILMDHRGKVKIGDFGLAKVLGPTPDISITVPGSSLGTPFYTAPEQHSESESADQRADVYSMGAVLYEMLTGLRPQGDFEYPSLHRKGVSPAVDRAVKRALARNPEKRFAQIEVFRKALRWGKEKAVDDLRRWMLSAGAGLAVGAGLFVYWEPHESEGKKVNHFDEANIRTAEVEPTTSLEDASLERPYINSLGMRFVPLPGTQVLFCIWETRLVDYEAFSNSNPKLAGGEWRDLEHQGYKQGPLHPVVNVNWYHAKAFCEWLSQKENLTYRLPMDFEWSIAVGLGELEDADGSPVTKHGKLPQTYPWGSFRPPPVGIGNFFDSATKDRSIIVGHDDPFPFTAPVGSFRPNHFGIYDIAGNAWEWCEDLFNPDAKRDERRILRGGAWDSGIYRLRSSFRNAVPPGMRFRDKNVVGFRCVIELPEESGGLSALTEM